MPAESKGDDAACSAKSDKAHDPESLVQDFRDFVPAGVVRTLGRLATVLVDRGVVPVPNPMGVPRPA